MEKTENLDSLEYIRKMDELLQYATRYDRLSTNPLKKLQSKYKNQMKIILKDHPDLERQFQRYK